MADLTLKRWNGTSWEEVNPQTTHTQIVASGTPSSTTYLRGDGTWATISAGSTFTGGTVTGDIEISNTLPKLKLTDTDHNSDFQIVNNNGTLELSDTTNQASRVQIGSNGDVILPATGGLTLVDKAITNSSGALLFDGDEIYHEGHKPTLTELGAAAASHTHSIANVTGLQTALDGKTTESYVNTAISNLVDSSPATLDTLNELAAALGDDPNFATTVTNSIASKSDVGHTHDDRYYTESEANGRYLARYSTSSLNVNAENGTQLFIGSTGSWTNRGPSGNNAGALFSINTHPGAYYSQMWFDTAGSGLYHRTSNASAPTTAWQRIYEDDYHPIADTATNASGVTFTTQQNATWGGQIQLGGNGSDSGNTLIAKVQSTNGNLHLDPGTGKATYLNYYANGTIYLNGTTYSISSNGGYYNGTSAAANSVAWNNVSGKPSINTIIGTDSDINTSGSTIIDNIYVTDGVITSMGTRTLTAADIGALTTSGKAADANLFDGINSDRFVYGQNSTKTTNISNFDVALSSGFFDSYQATGSPSSTWYHLLNTRHNNSGNNYQMQFAGEFYNSSNIFYRITAGSNGGTWHRLWHSGNDGSGSGLHADLLDGYHESTFMRREANSTLDMNNNDIYGVDQIFHHGDTNTYMQFHTSDQWRVVTGGSQRLEVNNSYVYVTNALTIGTETIPTNRIFHVEGNASVRDNMDVGDITIGGGGTFYTDSGSRVRINQDFYTNNNATYLYANSLYLGNSSGDNIYVRANVMSGNGFSINGSSGFGSFGDLESFGEPVWTSGNLSFSLSGTTLTITTS